MANELSKNLMYKCWGNGLESVIKFPYWLEILFGQVTGKTLSFFFNFNVWGHWGLNPRPHHKKDIKNSIIKMRLGGFEMGWGSSEEMKEEKN